MITIQTAYATQNEPLWQFDSALQVERACKDFFEKCEAHHTPPTVFGLCLELGTNPHTLRRWLADDPVTWHCEIADVNKRRRCAEAVGEAMIKIGKFAEESLYDKDSVKGAVKVLSDLFDVLPKKAPPEPLQIIIPDSLKDLAK